MDKKVLETCKKITEAAGPEEIFGGLGGKGQNRSEKLKALEKEFQELSSVLAVDSSGFEPTALEKLKEARDTLAELYQWAKSKVVGENQETEEKPSGQSGEVVITTKKRSYYLTEALAEGELFTVYRGYYLQDTAPVDVIFKIIKDPADNSFAKKEAEVLKLLYSEPNNEGRQLKHLPQLIDEFLTAENQRGNILSYLDGYDLEVVKAKYKKGVDRKHVVWMLNRFLSVLGYVHSRGVIHGNIMPANLLIRPRDHNLWMIGWGCSVANPEVNGAKFLLFNEDFSAPEIKQRPELPSRMKCKSPADSLYLDAIFSSDIYSVGKCMIYLLGGDVKSNKMPKDVELPLQRFIQGFVIESPLQRPRDAWEMYAELRKIITALWGPRQFLEFKM